MAHSTTSAGQITYYLDDKPFHLFGVYVAASEGLLSRPKMKVKHQVQWDTYHGEEVDLSSKYVEARQITLHCFCLSESRGAFIAQVNAFLAQFDKPGLACLKVETDPIRPLLYMVYCKDEVDIKKEWSQDSQMGTFTLKLIEPQPVKRVLRFECRKSRGKREATVRISSPRLMNIFWGDGSQTLDVIGNGSEVRHEYQEDGIYFPLITGNIEEITDFNTNADIVWSRL